MIINEITFKELRDIYDPAGTFLICGQVPETFIWFDQYERCEAFMPSNVKEYQAGLISKEDFIKKWRRKINTPVCKALVRHLHTLNNVYLVTDTGFLGDIIVSI
jgi:hypothetical protein